MNERGIITRSTHSTNADTALIGKIIINEKSPFFFLLDTYDIDMLNRNGHIYSRLRLMARQIVPRVTVLLLRCRCVYT